jgi:hypothetical protein
MARTASPETGLAGGGAGIAASFPVGVWGCLDDSAVMTAGVPCGRRP